MIATGMLIGSQAFALLSPQAAFTSGQNVWSDNSGELFVNNNSSGTPDVGDYVLGFFGFDTINGQPASNYNDLTGIFALEIATVTPTGPNQGNFTFSAPGVGLVNAFAAGGVTAPTPISADPNVAFEIFEGPPNDFTRQGSTSFATLVGTADNGTQMMDWAITNGQITATVPLNLNAPPFPLPVGTGIGSFQGSATIVYQNFPGYIFSPLVTIVGNNSMPNNPSSLGFDSDPTKYEPYNVRNDTSFTLTTTTTTPEPATLALLGLGLLGLGAVRRWS